MVSLAFVHAFECLAHRMNVADAFKRVVRPCASVVADEGGEGGVEGGLNPSRDVWRWIEHNLQYLFGPLLEAEVNWAEPEPPSPRVAPSLVDLCLSPLAQVPP